MRLRLPSTPRRYGLLDSDDEEGESDGELEGFGVRRAPVAAAEAAGVRRGQAAGPAGAGEQQQAGEGEPGNVEEEGFVLVEDEDMAPQESKASAAAAAALPNPYQ